VLDFTIEYDWLSSVSEGFGLSHFPGLLFDGRLPYATIHVSDIASSKVAPLFKEHLSLSWTSPVASYAISARRVTTVCRMRL
jgi:hypothetical protein